MKTCLELDLEVEYTFTPGYPEYISGPPEMCYEGSDDLVEIASVKLNGNEIVDFLTDKKLAELSLVCHQHEKDRLSIEGPND